MNEKKRDQWKKENKDRLEYDFLQRNKEDLLLEHSDEFEKFCSDEYDARD